MQSADQVWCSTRRLSATLRRRWNVEAQLLYPPGELAPAPATAGPRRLVLAAADGVSAAWNARLDTLARWRGDLVVVKHGADPRGRRHDAARHEPACPERFRALLPQALAVVMPPGDIFDPRAVWAAEAGVPVVTPISSASAETVEGLEGRHPTGVLLDEPSDSALADGVTLVERHPDLFGPERLRAHAARWSRARFRQTLKSLVLEAWCRHVAADAATDDHLESAPAAATATASVS
jgi:hypothetical protein